MRRAGYECRVLAEEGGSYEENPPHILEFIRRDLRWCHGNMQYFKLLGEPGLKLTSRIQLVLAILMFIGSPAWMLFVLTATGALAFPQWVPIDMQVFGPGYLLFALIMTMLFAPKFASIFDILLRSKLRNRYGGAGYILTGAFFEIIFSMMLAPIMAVANTIFLFKLFVLRKSKGWAQQDRKTSALPFSVTAKHLWPQMLFGLIGFTVIFSGDKADWVTIAMCIPVFVGPLFVLPFAISSSHPGLGQLAARFGLWHLPEEKIPPVIIRALHLPAVMQRSSGSEPQHVRSPLSTEDLLDTGSDVEQVIVNQTSR